MRSIGLFVLLFLAASVSTGAAERADRVRHVILQETLAQAERPGADWDPGQRDCAGFVRLLYRKATGIRDPLWLRSDGTRAHFVTADELVAYNFSSLFRTPVADRIETGDLLVFFNPAKPPEDAWHLMVLLRPPGGVPDRVLAVYHNGAIGAEAAVRKVWLADLEGGPPEWRPASDNPRFVGVVRWNGWAELPKESD